MQSCSISVSLNCPLLARSLVGSSALAVLPSLLQQLPMSISNKELVNKYFVKQADGCWKCQCGKTRKQGKGWANLLDHIHRDHGDTVLDARSSANSSISTCFRKKEINMYHWMQWICQDLLPFSFCENANTRQFTKLEPVSVKTLKIHMQNFKELLENKIQQMLPKQICYRFRWVERLLHSLSGCLCRLPGRGNAKRLQYITVVVLSLKWWRVS